MTTQETWLDLIPALPCPEGSTVRRGDTLGSVTRDSSNGVRWTIAFHGSDMRESGNGAPEDDHFGEIGWRHALDTDEGWSRVIRSMTRCATGRGQILKAWGRAGGTIKGHRELELRLLQGDDITDADRLRLAKAASALVAP